MKPTADLFARRLVVLGAALFFTLVLAHGFLANPVADDFSNAMQIQEAGGLFAFVKGLYFRWTGRAFSNVLLWLAFQFPQGFTLSSFLLAVTQLAAAPMLLAVFFGTSLGELRQEWKARRSALLFTAWLSSLALWFAWDPFLAQCVFWPTGGLVYLAPFLAVVLWLRCAVSSPRQAGGPMVALGLGLSLLLGTAHEQLSAAVLLAGVPVWLRDLRRALSRRSVSRDEMLRWGLVVAFVLGTAIALAAPGNFARATHSPYVFPKWGLPILRAIRDVIRSFLPYFLSAAAYGLIVGIFSGVFQNEKKKPTSHGRLLGTSAALATFGSLVPLMSVPGFASLRTFFIPSGFAFVAFATLGAGARWLEWLRRILRKRSAAVQILGSVILLGVMAETFSEPLRRAVQLRGELRVREVEIQAQAERMPRPSVLFLSALRTPAPRWIHTDDITPDPKHWINEAVAKYYGFSEARLGSY